MPHACCNSGERHRLSRAEYSSQILLYFSYRARTARERARPAVAPDLEENGNDPECNAPQPTPCRRSCRAGVRSFRAPCRRTGKTGQDRHRHVPLRRGGGPVRRAGAQRRRSDRRSAQRGQGSRALRNQGTRRRADRDRIRRRGRRHDQAGQRIPQPRAARQRRRGHRLHLQRRLPRGRAGRRGAEEADGVLRLRHAAHLRGRELQVPVPHRRDGDDGQYGGGALPDRNEAGPEKDRRHQPELRLGPGLVERLRSRDESPQARRRNRRPRRCRSSSPASTARRSRRC